MEFMLYTDLLSESLAKQTSIVSKGYSAVFIEQQNATVSLKRRLHTSKSNPYKTKPLKQKNLIKGETFNLLITQIN